MNEEERRRYLDEIFYDYRPIGKIHLLGMMHPQWFTPYPAAEGDNTSWIPRAEWNRRKSINEWLQEYGEQWIPYSPKQHIQMRFA